MSPAADAFKDCLRQQGTRPALCEAGRNLNYAELLKLAELQATRLTTLKAQRVALALDNGIDWVVWDLAALFAGVVCVPLPSFFSTAQQQHVLDNAGVELLIGSVAGISSDFKPLDHELMQRSLPQLPALPEGTCKITYTSGTTGQPKGVCLSFEHQLQVAQSLWQASQSTNPEQHLCVLPLATLLENIAGIYAPLLGGACIRLHPLSQIGFGGARGFDVSRFINTLHECAPNSLILLPQLLLALVMAAEQGVVLPQSLRFIAVGGGRVAAQLLERAQRLKLPVFEGYGLSECASVVCLNTPKAQRLGSVGRPLPHVQVKLADDGEVLVQGNAMLGYLGEPPLNPEDWLATGDLGHFEEGFLVLHGRKKNQFITAYGRNVNPEWVEAELVQQAAIAQAWVYGEALAENFAVIVPRQPHLDRAAIQTVIDGVNAGLPDYARVHRWILAEAPFTAENGLSTSNGRLRRGALREHYAAALEAAVASSVSLS